VPCIGLCAWIHDDCSVPSHHHLAGPGPVYRWYSEKSAKMRSTTKLIRQS
jgi:hypothetical protein